MFRTQCCRSRKACRTSDRVKLRLKSREVTGYRITNRFGTVAVSYRFVFLNFFVFCNFFAFYFVM